MADSINKQCFHDRFGIIRTSSFCPPQKLIKDYAEFKELNNPDYCPVPTVEEDKPDYKDIDNSNFECCFPEPETPFKPVPHIFCPCITPDEPIFNDCYTYIWKELDYLPAPDDYINKKDLMEFPCDASKTLKPDYLLELYINHYGDWYYDDWESKRKRGELYSFTDEQKAS